MSRQSPEGKYQFTLETMMPKKVEIKGGGGGGSPTKKKNFPTIVHWFMADSNPVVSNSDAPLMKGIVGRIKKEPLLFCPSHYIHRASSESPFYADIRDD